MILLNGTPDDIEWMHVGVCGTIKSGTIQEFDEARGNHLANKFGRRGIVQMQYGDDETEKKEKSKELWAEFWEDQITRFNQHNEDQKEKGNRYAKPPKFLSDRAKSFGLELLEPWKIKAPDESKELSEMKKNNEEQAATIKNLVEQVSKLTTMFANNEPPNKGGRPKAKR